MHTDYVKKEGHSLIIGSAPLSLFNRVWEMDEANAIIREIPPYKPLKLCVASPDVTGRIQLIALWQLVNTEN